MLFLHGKERAMAGVRKRTWTTAKGEQKSAWVFDWLDNSGRRQRRQFERKRDADAFRIEIENQLLTGTYRANARQLSVSDLAKIYLSHCQQRMERDERMTRHNYAVYRGHVHNHVLNPKIGIGTCTLAQLTAATVSDFRDRLRENGMSVPTTRKVLSTLHAMLEYACARDLIANNPSRNIRVLGSRTEGARKITPPTKADLATILDAATHSVFLKILVAATTGLRAGEFHALRWRHIDFETRELTVETRVDAYRTEGVTKTAAGTRTIPLGEGIVSQLKRWRLQSEYSSNSDLVFPNKKGAFENHDNMVKRQFKPLFEVVVEKFEKEQIADRQPPAYFNWHSLRHFAISCWIEAGLSPKTIQTFAGHSSLQVTMDRYGHLFPSEEHQKAMDEIAKQLLV